MTNEDWQDKMAAQQRHEHLEATVRIAVGELCHLAEQVNDLPTVERIYGITEFLEREVKGCEVAYESAASPTHREAPQPEATK